VFNSSGTSIPYQNLGHPKTRGENVSEEGRKVTGTPIGEKKKECKKEVRGIPLGERQKENLSS